MTDEPVPKDQKLSRRKMMRVAIATAPIIATIPTGAALARSSNVISASAPGDSLDRWGRTLCLDARSGTLDASRTSLDLGPSPSGSVVGINQRDYRVDANWGAAKVSEADMCKHGGTFNYWNYGWRKVKVPRGLTVSATALSSFAGRLYTTDV